jgi:hypothetical protein
MPTYLFTMSVDGRVYQEYHMVHKELYEILEKCVGNQIWRSNNEECFICKHHVQLISMVLLEEDYLIAYSPLVDTIYTHIKQFSSNCDDPHDLKLRRIF